MSDLPAVPAIDYTSRDYQSVLDDLIGLIPQYLPAWTSRSPNDFGVVMLEMFAYVADQLHYYADRIANEAYLDTATQRASLLRLARLYGYTPSTGGAASVSLTINNSGAAPVAVAAGTKVSTISSTDTAALTFETDSAVTVPANGLISVSAHEGVTITSEQIGSSDGTQGQGMSLFNTGVVQGSIHVFVNDGTLVEWTYVQQLLVSGPTDRVYTLLVDSDNVVTVQFGDGANGKIPPFGSVVTATYRIGNGSLGNVGAGAITQFIDNVPGTLTVTNPASAISGFDADTIETLRDNATRSISTLRRAVTLADYADLAVLVPGVGKASADAGTATSVFVTVAPAGGGGLDGSGNPTAQFSALMTSVGAALSTTKPANTTVTVRPAKYVSVNITAVLHAVSTARQSRLIDLSTLALTDLLSFDNVILGDQITQSDIHLALAEVDGVAWSDVTLLQRSDTNTDPVFTSTEIPVLGTVSITVLGGTA